MNEKHQELRTFDVPGSVREHSTVFDAIAIIFLRLLQDRNGPDIKMFS